MDVHSKLATLDFVVMGIYVVSVLALGFYVSLRKKHSEDLFLAGRSLGWCNIGFSIFGTNVSGNQFISAASIAYVSGIVAGNFAWFGYFFMLLLALVFIPHYLNYKISTMPEFVSRRFDNRCRTFLSWYTVLTTVVVWLGGILYCGGLLLSQIMNWPVWLCVMVLACIATSFTVAGGLEAVVITDTFQAILMIVGSAALVVIGLQKVGGIDKLIESVPPDYWKLIRSTDDAYYPWHAILLGYPVLGVWFWCTDQTIVQRVLGARDLKQGQLGVAWGCLLKTLVPFLFFVPGILCKVLHPNLSDPDAAYVTMIANYLPIGMTGLIIAVLVSALISTVDSGLNSLSTVFTLDIWCKKVRPNASVKERILIGRITTVGAALIAVLYAIGLTTIKGMNLWDLMISVNSFLAPTLAVVFLLGVFWKRATSTAAFWTMVICTICSVSFGVYYLKFWPEDIAKPHFMILTFYNFVVQAVFMIIVSLFTQKPSAEQLLPPLRQAYSRLGRMALSVKLAWIALGIMTVLLYIIFN
ncbi:MAG: sodium:solute symporter family transporter [Planctomycetota bacterium]|jgi:SSS family solute:Na+ symporter